MEWHYTCIVVKSMPVMVQNQLAKEPKCWICSVLPLLILWCRVQKVIYEDNNEDFVHVIIILEMNLFHLCPFMCSNDSLPFLFELVPFVMNITLLWVSIVTIILCISMKRWPFCALDVLIRSSTSSFIQPIYSSSFQEHEFQFLQQYLDNWTDDDAFFLNQSLSYQFEFISTLQISYFYPDESLVAISWLLLYLIIRIYYISLLWRRGNAFLFLNRRIHQYLWL